MSRLIHRCAGVIALLLLASTASAGEKWNALINTDNSFTLSFVREGRPVFQVALNGWGPKWSWVKLESQQKAENDRLSLDVPFVVNKARGEVIDIHFEVWQPSARQVVFQYDLDSDHEVPLTQLVAAVYFDPQSKGTLRMFHAGGPSYIFQKGTLPTLETQGTPPINRTEFNFDQGGIVKMQIDPPRPIFCENGMRVRLAEDVYHKGKRRVRLTLNFPDDVAFYGKQSEIDKASITLAGPDWFPFQPINKEVLPGIIDMNRWLDGPAGKHGGVRMNGDRFVFEDGTPVKFWGTSLNYTDVAPDQETADITAARFAKYGINSVRLHKFTRPDGKSGIGDPNDCTRMEPKALDRFDYLTSQLKERGIYFGWSHTFGFQVLPSDRNRLLAYDEIAKNLGGNTYAFIHFAEDVQDLMIEMIVNLLKHKNPYTGRTYAEEPALCFVELQNEDGIFFYGSVGGFNACPTYKKRFMARFAAWLKERYGTQEKLEAAWDKALNPGDTLAGENIVPEVNPWFFSEDNLPKKKGGVKQRLLDTAAFLHDIQERFNRRYVEAIRAAGYQGPLIASTWQGPRMLPHYYNLYSDYKSGFIDRHNYFGGTGPAMTESMLTRPGNGYFINGMQQVRDRPFALSEWIHVYPNIYAAEGPALMATYGLGLQGWDASYEFHSLARRHLFNEVVGVLPKYAWSTDRATSLGQYPSLARMIARGDVKEGDIISVRRVSPADLAKGEFSFDDKVEQPGDVTTTGGSVPTEALAAGRVVVEFTDQSEEPLLPDMSRYREGSVIKSTTGQLAWDTSGQGFFTVNTAGTKAVVGFTGGQEQTLGDVKMRIESPFASVFLTALEREQDLTNCKQALITVLARESNTDFRYFGLDNRILDNGHAPILLEPVRAMVTIAGRPIAEVHILDHDGRRTGRTLPVSDGTFTIDGTNDKAIYYEVVFSPDRGQVMTWTGTAVGLGLIVAVCFDCFAVLILTRRGRGRIRPSRWFSRTAWGACQSLARLFPAARNSFLSVAAALSMLGPLVLWAAGLIIGFGLLHWSLGTVLEGTNDSFLADLSFSGATFVKFGRTELVPIGLAGAGLRVVEVALGFAFVIVFLVYLPALYRAATRREVTI